MGAQAEVFLVNPRRSSPPPAEQAAAQRRLFVADGREDEASRAEKKEGDDERRWRAWATEPDTRLQSSAPPRGELQVWLREAAHPRVCGECAGAFVLLRLGEERLRSSLLNPADPSGWQRFSVLLDVADRRQAVLEIAAVAWLPGSGERRVGRAVVPARDVIACGCVELLEWSDPPILLQASHSTVPHLAPRRAPRRGCMLRVTPRSFRTSSKHFLVWQVAWVDALPFHHEPAMHWHPALGDAGAGDLVAQVTRPGLLHAPCAPMCSHPRAVRPRQQRLVEQWPTRWDDAEQRLQRLLAEGGGTDDERFQEVGAPLASPARSGAPRRERSASPVASPKPRPIASSASPTAHTPAGGGANWVSGEGEGAAPTTASPLSPLAASPQKPRAWRP
jgi:hypothetical protein